MKQAIATIALLLLVAAADDPGPGLEPGLRRVPLSPGPGWPKYCGTASMAGTPTSHSPITAPTVTAMALAWRATLQRPPAAPPFLLPKTVDRRHQGRLEALDRITGEGVAVARFVGDGGTGSGVWTSPAVDVQNHKVFVTTGSGVDFFDGTGCSIIRLDLATLALEDMWKVDADYATWDADWGSSPTLFTDAAGRELVGAGHKDGRYYAFLRSDLASGPVWSAEVALQGEVPQEGGGTLSTAAFDGARLYVGGGSPPDSTDPDAHGSVVALDPANGTVLWRQAVPGAVIAPVSTVNGVVFAAGGNLVEALGAADGKVLWSYRTDSLLFGGIAIARDTIFVGDLSGKLYAFRIP